mgnify:CR=1 FL=1
MSSNSNITPQYQSYGETSARADKSPMEALTFKVPLTPMSKAKERKRKVKVMEEDEYVAKVEKIIERDFFPELDKLKAVGDRVGLDGDVIDAPVVVAVPSSRNGVLEIGKTDVDSGLTCSSSVPKSRTPESSSSVPHTLR